LDDCAEGDDGEGDGGGADGLYAGALRVGEVGILCRWYEIRRLWGFSSDFPIVENNSCLGVRQLLCQGIVWAYEFSAVPARAWIDRASGIRESTVGDRPPRLFGRGPGEQSGGRRDRKST